MSITRQLCAALSVVLLSFNALGATGVPKRPTPRRAKPAARSTRTQTARPTPFKSACTTPSFPSPPPAAKLGIDAQCGVTGAGTGAEAQQNAAKNNFCAKGAAKPITIADLTNLQTQVTQNKSINFGDEPHDGIAKGPTTNRAPLKRLGEGRLVTLKAFILVARQEGGESVNCGKNVPNQPLFHDIHISLVASPDVKEECAGVVAEMSPHRRPDSWTHVNVEKVARAGLPVRVTGQLYFDSSHLPCANGQRVRSNPSRVSLWEIHPIYKFEVCTADCDGAGTWVTLDKWAAQQ